MKIVFINTLYYPNIVGGAEISVQLLAEGVLDTGMVPVVITLGEFDKISYVNGVKVYTLKIQNLYWPYKEQKSNKQKLLKPLWFTIDTFNPLMAKKVRTIFRTEKPDIVHTNSLTGFSVSIWSEAKKQNIPLVHTLRNLYLLCIRGTMFTKEKKCTEICRTCKFFSFPKKQKSTLVDSVVGISDFILKKHNQYGYFKNSKQLVIPNPIEAPINIKNKVVSKHLKFGFIGSITFFKGLELALDAFLELNSTECEFLIAGKGNPTYVEKLQKKYKSKKIIFLGWSSPEKFFTQIDVLVVPSLGYEAFGRIIIESYSYGVPVIGSDIGGISEIIDIKKTGFKFKSNDKMELISIMKYILTNKKALNDMKSNCLEYSQFFYKNIIAEKYINLYRRIIKCR